MVLYYGSGRASENMFTSSTSIKQEQVKKDDIIEIRKLDPLSSQIKQGLHDWIKQDKHDLAEKKNKGYKVSYLKLKKLI